MHVNVDEQILPFVWTHKCCHCNFISQILNFPGPLNIGAYTLIG
jgi:hypothetical protein